MWSTEGVQGPMLDAWGAAQYLCDLKQHFPLKLLVNLIPFVGADQASGCPRHLGQGLRGVTRWVNGVSLLLHSWGAAQGLYSFQTVGKKLTVLSFL